MFDYDPAVENRLDSKSAKISQFYAALVVGVDLSPEFPLPREVPDAMPHVADHLPVEFPQRADGDEAPLRLVVRAVGPVDEGDPGFVERADDLLLLPTVPAVNPVILLPSTRGISVSERPTPLETGVKVISLRPT